MTSFATPKISQPTMPLCICASTGCVLPPLVHALVSLSSSNASSSSLVRATHWLGFFYATQNLQHTTSARAKTGYCFCLGKRNSPGSRCKFGMSHPCSCGHSVEPSSRSRNLQLLFHRCSTFAGWLGGMVVIERGKEGGKANERRFEVVFIYVCAAVASSLHSAFTFS